MTGQRLAVHERIEAWVRLVEDNIQSRTHVNPLSMPQRRSNTGLSRMSATYSALLTRPVMSRKGIGP